MGSDLHFITASGHPSGIQDLSIGHVCGNEEAQLSVHFTNYLIRLVSTQSIRLCGVMISRIIRLDSR